MWDIYIYRHKNRVQSMFIKDPYKCSTAFANNRIIRWDVLNDVQSFRNFWPNIDLS